MSRWHETFQQHQFHKRLDSITEILSGSEFKKIESTAEQEISRLKKILDLFVSTISKIDQELISAGELNNFQDQLSSIEQQLNNYKNNSNLSHLQSANNHVDNLFDRIGQYIAFAAPTSEATETNVSINSLVQRGEEFLVALDERKKELQHQITGLKTSSTNLEKKFTELQQQVDTKVSELNQLTNVWTTQFNESQTDKEERFREALTNIEGKANTETDEIISKLNNSVSDHQTNYNNEFDSLLEDAKNRHTNIKELHGLVSNDSVMAGHENKAADEASAANKWRLSSIFFALLAIAWLAFVFYLSGEVNWKASVSGLPITIIILSIAGYAGHQSSLHRHQANRQGQFALEMKAIDPYLENLGDEERKNIKAQLTNKYFGDLPNHEKKNLIKDSVILPNSVLDRLLKLLEK